MFKSFIIFKKNGAHLVEKNKDIHLKFECFEHAIFFLVMSNFEINRKHFQKNYDNPNCYAFFAIFQTYKNEVLKRVHSLGWLL
jgi:hypothetical protein